MMADFRFETEGVFYIPAWRRRGSGLELDRRLKNQPATSIPAATTSFFQCFITIL